MFFEGINFDFVIWCGGVFIMILWLVFIMWIGLGNFNCINIVVIFCNIICWLELCILDIIMSVEESFWMIMSCVLIRVVCYFLKSK